MAEKVFKTRIMHRHNTEAVWATKTTFVPKAGELIIYDVDATHVYPRVKFGDGVTRLSSLPFMVSPQTPVSDPTASGTAEEFIATISQDANGVITATKKTVSSLAPITDAEIDAIIV